MPVDTAKLQSVNLVEVARRNFLLIGLLGLVGLLAGVMLGSRMEESATATTPILLNPLEGNAFYPSSRGEQLINLATEAQALRSDAVATLAEARLDGSLSTDELLSGVKVSVPANTQILEVSFSDADPDVALSASQAFAETYLEHRQSRARARIDEQTAQLNDQIAARTNDLELLAAESSALETGSAEQSINQQRQSAIASQIATLVARRAELTSISLDAGQVVTPAALQSSGPISLPQLLPIVGLFAGLMGGLILGTLRRRVDTRIHSPDDVRNLGVRVIGTIGWEGGGAASDPTLDASRGEDEFRRCRVAILAQETRRPFSVLLAPASDASALAMVALDLATSFARSGLDTVLIDATTAGRGPVTLSAPKATAGLSEILLGDTTFSEALTSVAPLLGLVGPGGDIARVADLFQSREMSRLLTDAKANADVVLLAADSVQHGDAQSLANAADATIVHVEQGLTNRFEIEQAARALDMLETNFVGTIFIGQGHRDTSVFSSAMALAQRQLPPGPFAALRPGARPVGPGPPIPPLEPLGPSGSDQPLADDKVNGNS